ncbi:MAG: hypothetical protein V4564_00555 [Pseudomonadota bacterium]|uniref:hypothetical protein n=1 Tax=Sphingomonas sp. ERG5 TaxID=1381597 RepID=UPI00054BA80E|nr:hypothetical protein [Sphingomonas sp. ERG5]
MSVSEPPGTGTNDGTTAAPRLAAGMSFITIADLPDWSAGPKGDTAAIYAALKQAGYETIQTLDPAAAHAAGLIPTGIARVFHDPAELRGVAARWRDAGCDCTTIQLGTGVEDDDQMARLAEALLEAAVQEGHPLFLETHRATMTQDIRRTVDLVARFPDLRFNGDFAHWYIGHELTYGDMEMKFDVMRSVFARTRFLHLRVCSNAVGQLSASDPAAAKHLDFFKRMWTESFRSFLAAAPPGGYFTVMPELLPPRSFYPRMVTGPDGQPREESDRWTDAAFLIDTARVCFDAAREMAGA